MPRLFTGLEIPRDVGMRLAALRGGLQGARWLDSDNYHITLRFIGDIDSATARDIFSILGDRKQHGAIPVTLDEMASFGGDKPRALYARVTPTPALTDLQMEQERLIRRVGIAPEARKFVPHVTLARLRESSAGSVADYIASWGQFPKMTFTARRFVLFSSRDSVGGGPYVVEAAYPLD